MFRVFFTHSSQVGLVLENRKRATKRHPQFRNQRCSFNRMSYVHLSSLLYTHHNKRAQHRAMGATIPFLVASDTRTPRSQSPEDSGPSARFSVLVASPLRRRSIYKVPAGTELELRTGLPCGIYPQVLFNGCLCSISWSQSQALRDIRDSDHESVSKRGLYEM